MSKPLSINQVLPVEMLSIIFSFINPSLDNLYPHLPLSLVCRHWRQVIVNNPQFWNILEYQETETDYKYFREQVIHRSQSHKLHICVFASVYEDSDPREFESLKKHIVLKSFCVKSLSFDYLYIGTDNSLSWLDFPFPQLENLSISHLEGKGLEDEKNIKYLNRLITGTRLRRLDVSSDMLLRLDGLGLIQHLSSIEWLKLVMVVGPKLDISRILEILRTELPNLQILNISSKGCVHYSTAEIITLPKVRILTLDNLNVASPTFNIPNLDYFSIIRCPPKAFETWPHFGTIDFSRIRHIRVGLHGRMTTGRYSLREERYSYRGVCMTGMTDSSVDCDSFQDFHENGMISQAIATQNNLDISPKNTFHLIIHRHTKPESIFVLQQTTNLTELTLDYGSIPSNTDYHTFLANIMRSTQTIVRLNIVHAPEFVEACRPLTQKDTAPRLERLLYHNSFLFGSTASLPHHVRLIQQARAEASLQPLKVLEVRNFAILPNDQVREIEKMGIQFIQS